jgi:hypothetical protein
MHAVILSATFLADCSNAGLSEDEAAHIIAVISGNPLLGDIIPGPAERANFGLQAGARVNPAATEL